MEMLSQALWVALGAAVGGPARAWASAAIARRLGEYLPYGTLIVNVSGAALIGAAAGCAARGPLSAHSDAWLFAVTGALGSYTTVSSFSLQSLTLLRKQAPRAALYAVLSIGLCLAAAAIGYAAAGAR